MAAQDLIQAPLFQVLPGERGDGGGNFVAHHGDRDVTLIAQPFDGVDGGAREDAEDARDAAGGRHDGE
jgi:hypothetical protein